MSKYRLKEVIILELKFDFEKEISKIHDDLVNDVRNEFHNPLHSEFDSDFKADIIIQTTVYASEVLMIQGLEKYHQKLSEHLNSQK